MTDVHEFPLQPKTENNEGDTFDQWLQKVSAALAGFVGSWGRRVDLIFMFNCNYDPIAAGAQIEGADVTHRRANGLHTREGLKQAIDAAHREAWRNQPRRGMVRRVREISYHRNGCFGAGFHLVRFAGPGQDQRDMIGVVFDEAEHCAVLSAADLAAKWRGDNYEPELRDAISVGPVQYG